MKWLPLVVVLAALAAGCAGVPSRPAGPETAAAWNARRAALAPVSSWDLRGRMALRTTEDSINASVHWVRHDRRHDIDLVGPLGGGHVRLSHDDNGAQLRATNGKIYHAPDPEELLYRSTGWRLPLAGLNYWVLGLPAPEAPGTEEFDERGRLRVLKQLGWNVQFLAYAEQHGYDLPSKLYLSRGRADGAGPPDLDAELELRLVISRWDYAR